MKKAVSILIIALVMFFSTVSVFAHPNVPPQSLNKVSENAAKGLHTAWGMSKMSKALRHMYSCSDYRLTNLSLLNTFAAEPFSLCFLFVQAKMLDLPDS